ncbi:hypothetical protein LTR84_007171 [Exophiala bonariae]|uniref:Altered inheritance of mitochondria protein 11 n=1 Tax=Exophiala bonariae TaxID=1690606 RepID=A0AAV9MZ83_9EURO|nr:hypothetical protein LTR84_007171 [Exophiala bonariae]
MSWLTSWFTVSQTASSPASPQPATEQKRLLEEPVSKLETPSPILAQTQSEQNPTSQQIVQRDQPHKPKVIFGAGLVFLGFSLLITRRAFLRKRFTNPLFYGNSPEAQAEQAKKINGTLEALEALNLATINVASVALTAAGGTMWYYDVRSMSEVRRRLKGEGRTEKEAEAEFEEAMAMMLARKETSEPASGDKSQ